MAKSTTPPIFLIILSARSNNRAAENVPTEAKSLTEVNKELTNPISSIWAIAFQQNTYWLNRPERNNVNLQFKPCCRFP
jgi:hypothetical protein